MLGWESCKRDLQNRSQSKSTQASKSIPYPGFARLFICRRNRKTADKIISSYIKSCMASIAAIMSSCLLQIIIRKNNTNSSASAAIYNPIGKVFLEFHHLPYMPRINSMIASGKNGRCILEQILCAMGFFRLEKAESYRQNLSPKPIHERN